MASGWLLHLMQEQWERLFGEREAASCKLLAASWFSQERWYKVNYVVVEQEFHFNHLSIAFYFSG